MSTGCEAAASIRVICCSMLPALNATSDAPRPASETPQTLGTLPDVKATPSSGLLSRRSHASATYEDSRSRHSRPPRRACRQAGAQSRLPPDAASCLRKKWLQNGPMAKVEMRACSAPAAGLRTWYASTWRQMVRSFSTAPSVSRKMYGIPMQQQQQQGCSDSRSRRKDSPEGC